MGYQVSWLEEQRVINVYTFGDLTFDDIRASSRITVEWIRSGVAPVHTIVDAREATQFPNRVNEFRQALVHPRSSKVGWIIVVTDDPIMKLFTSLIAKVFHYKLRIAKTHDEAIQFLQRIDNTLTIQLPEVG
ncbi:MAG: hypothetical protein D6737_11930 [Chloroflexi bacterium]|nr:MAG: hypothetical protein D6737_11930 [Chloroflexota bacterium]